MPDPEILEHIQLYTYELNKRLELTCGFMAVDLEGRFEYLRTEETNMGNWIADVFYTEFDQCDIVIQNAGALRSNMVITAGHLTLKDLANLLPLKDHIVQLKVPGCIVREALENSVSQYPKTDGRFASVAGLSFTWDSDRAPFQRVVSVTMWDGSELDPQKIYTMACKYFLALGKDNYTCLQSQEVQMIGDLESYKTMQAIIASHFEQFGPDYKILPNRLALRQKRLKLLNANEQERSD